MEHPRLRGPLRPIRPHTVPGASVALFIAWLATSLAAIVLLFKAFAPPQAHEFMRSVGESYDWYQKVQAADQRRPWLEKIGIVPKGTRAEKERIIHGQ